MSSSHSHEAPLPPTRIASTRGFSGQPSSNTVGVDIPPLTPRRSQPRADSRRTIDISSYKFDGKGGAGAPPHTALLPIPDVFRGRYRDPKTAGQDYAAYADAAIASFTTRGEKVGGVIVESILSCGGQIVLPDGYLQAVYQKVRAAGGLCIADEVQVGLGRVGDHFWGFELQGVVPDIVTIG